MAFSVQFLGTQFDDDLNVRIVPGQTTPGLPKYAVADFSASRAVSRTLTACHLLVVSKIDLAADACCPYRVASGSGAVGVVEPAGSTVKNRPIPCR